MEIVTAVSNTFNNFVAAKSNEELVIIGIGAVIVFLILGSARVLPGSSKWK